jgi:hypothetical protein
MRDYHAPATRHVSGPYANAVLAVALIIDLRDGSLHSRMDRRAVRESHQTSQNEATLRGTFLGSGTNPGGG